ncbi:hypothetical protein CJ483_08800 [Bacillus sp. PK3_68]|nr:hypothetical protein CJ483_08800 [Bacillus sp. PK3_68]
MGYYYICSSCEKNYGIGFQGSYPSTVEFCPEDGAKLVKSCPKCNETIDKLNQKFCPHCGEKYVK